MYRRCGCRTGEGKLFALLPERPTAVQKTATCPILLRDSKHGSWGFATSAGVAPGTGKRQQIRRMGFSTKREAQQERAKAIDQVATGKYRGDRKLSVAAYMPAWLERSILDGMRPSTVRMYRRYVEMDIVPALGALKLAEVRKHHVDAFIRQLTADGRGATTVRRIHAVIRSALTSAERLDLIDTNPATKIALPATSKAKTRIWEPEQVREFLDQTSESRLAPVFELAIFTGLRRGELAGLRWVDVDLTKRELTVRQQRVQLGGAVLEGAVKTDSGQDRRVSLGSEAIGALIAWKIRQDAEREAWGVAYESSGHVFTYENGRPLRPAHISRTFETLVERSGLPHMRLHDLRHEHASLLLSGGVDIAIVSKRLGHSTIAITSDLYSHLLSDANRAAADAAESMLPPKKARAHTLHTQPV
ncbi:tyrosine-type recombinase/integrase [Subtercola boreus]|uniref:tyrosine-type recombinase/integrase n=1 Tax=Subtercola boreus TaxID=120213 RepID=UPI00209BCBA4|nr:tyrosine-type recombinase/integrase [Subtercola boreus]